jgi:hypothetical protein
VTRWLWSIFRWFRDIWRRLLRREAPFEAVRVEELDRDSLRPTRIYIEHRGGKDRWVHLLCPCGCKDLISLNLMTSHRPFWALTWHGDGTVSVMPSVDKNSGCRSHFFVTKGRVRWAKSYVTS